MTLRTLLLLGFSATLIACGGEPAAVSETNDTASVEATSESEATSSATEIAWEDLMPDGEDEVLEALYAEFYREFEERMMAQQRPLSAAGSGEFDLLSVTEGSDLDTMQQIGTFNVVEDLDGMSVRMPGYIVPLDFSAESKHTEFLLVPYFGACLHSPPPPPNQIVYVTADPAAEIPDIYEPVWIEGRMSTGRYDTEMGNSAYEIALARLDPYEY